VTAPVQSPTDHRERLLAGMADAIRETGSFQQTTVADIVRRARTSRRTFYEHFDDREDCFLALFDVVAAEALTAIAEEATGDASWAERVDRALAAYLDEVAAEPELSRACLQEIQGLGPRGAERVRRMTERWARQIVLLVEEGSRLDPAVQPISMEVATVISGGFRDLMIATLDQGRELSELQSVGSDLMRRLTARDRSPQAPDPLPQT
jgi:AcrR family transcriptional regulator